MGNKRTFSPSFKLRVCQDIDSGLKSRTETIREHNLADSVVAKWLAKYRSLGTAAFNDNSNEIKSLKNKINELEKALGRKTLEVEVLREVVEHSGIKRGAYTR